MFRKTLVLALALAAGSSFAHDHAPEAYRIDPTHTQVLFTYNHLGLSNITGRFDEVSGVVEFDPRNVSASSVVVDIAVGSIDTGVDALDEHLLRDDFFKDEQYPKARFSSTRVVEGEAGTLTIHGTLELNGHTGHVVLNGRLNGSKVHPMKKIPAVGFDASGTILRSDYGLGAATPNVGDEVHLSITVEALAVDGAAP